MVIKTETRDNIPTVGQNALKMDVAATYPRPLPEPVSKSNATHNHSRLISSLIHKLCGSGDGLRCSDGKLQTQLSSITPQDVSQTAVALVRLGWTEEVAWRQVQRAAEKVLPASGPQEVAMIAWAFAKQVSEPTTSNHNA